MDRTIRQCDQCAKEIDSNLEHVEVALRVNRSPTAGEILGMGVVPAGTPEEQIEEQRSSLSLSLVRDEQVLHFCSKSHLSAYFGEPLSK